tara:strand:- start:678 stop:1085 length:408 start_codon:yes stop_codon:yes gene_type:complete
MAIQQIYFDSDSQINVSAQIGDYAFYLNATPSDDKGIEWTSTAPTLFGVITEIDTNSFGPYIKVEDQDADLITLGFLTSGTILTPADGDLIMFAKDNSINRSGIKGHYMEVQFFNDSKAHAELFSVGSEITSSSK